MWLFYLRRLIITCIGFFLCLLMFALITFSPFDDTYFQFSGNDFFYNILGRFGAFFSDILFFIFGVVAYFLPFVVFFIFWNYLLVNKFLNFFDLSVKIIGCIVLLLSLCGLVEFFVNDFYYCFSGGIIGYLLQTEIFYIFNNFFVIFVFLFSVVLGVILIDRYFLISVFKCFFCLLFKFLTFCYNSYNKNKYLCIFFDFLKRKLVRIIGKFPLKNKFKIFLFSVKKCLHYIKSLKGIFYLLIFFRVYCVKFYYSFFEINKNNIFNFVFILVKKFFSNFKNTVIAPFKKSNLMSLFFLDKEKMKIQNLHIIFSNKVQIDDEYKSRCKKFQSNSIYFCKKNISENKKNIRNRSFLAVVPLPALRNFSFSNNIRQKKSKKLSKNFFYKLPSINLLLSSSHLEKRVNMDGLREKALLLESTLKNYRIQARVVNILKGPVITRFELDLAPGLKSSRISSLSRDLARSLSVSNINVLEIIPGKSYIGLEIPNQKRNIVYLGEVLKSEKFKLSRSFLTLGLGKDVSGHVAIADLNDMPHLLIAGTTGSGKSIGIHSIIVSILYKSTPEDVRFIMIDPKILELSVYEGIPHLFKNIITDTKDVIDVLNWCVEEMERRYKIMANYKVRNFKNYNDKVACNINEYKKSIYYDNNMYNFSSIPKFKKLPYIVIIIDEFSDLLLSSGKKIELLIVRLSQKARACGMHLILATQRPSVNVITGLIKANIPSRIAFAVSSKIDSRTILDQSGAESLFGMGDMLYLSANFSIPVRIHGSFISDREISLVVQHWKNVFIN